MNQFRRMFGITRVPKPGCDVLVGDHPSKAQHIIVLLKDQIFVVYVYDSKTGGRLRSKDIERFQRLISQFRECIKRVESGKKLQPPVGILSGQHRDKWAEHHGHLLAIDKKNAESFHMIETALFAVYLDHRIIPNDHTALAKNIFHGFNGHNRWFDKSLGIVSVNDGRIGLHGEVFLINQHSPCDALVPALLTDFASQKQPYVDGPDVVNQASIKPVQRLEWIIDAKIDQAFIDAQNGINNSISNSDLHILHYKKYGGDFIKKTGIDVVNQAVLVLMPMPKCAFS